MSDTSSCEAQKSDGSPCRMRPVRDGSLCFAHDPGHAKEAAEARRLGGKHRRREWITAGAFEVEALESVEGIRRVIEIAVLDTLSLESSVARARALFAGCAVLLKLREVSDLEERLQSVEAALRPRRKERKAS